MLLQEIAGRRKTEEELRLSEERFRRSFDEGPFGMILANPDYTIVMANKAFCGLLGDTEPELAGQSIADITCEEDREKCREFSGQFICKSPHPPLYQRRVRGDLHASLSPFRAWMLFREKGYKLEGS
ncbi:MAG: PAS domain S-box protein [Syntrophales bacterium]